MSEELHAIGNLHVTRVSAELKMARSLVRVADIQATLQEQRSVLKLKPLKKNSVKLGKPPVEVYEHRFNPVSMSWKS